MTTVSAVVICHADRPQLDQALDALKAQTQPPDEVIVTVCCMDTVGIQADVVLLDQHRDDWGQSKCDIGIRLATMEYVGLFSSDDGYEPTYLERMSKETADLVHCDFIHMGSPMRSVPETNRITRGCYLVRTRVAQRVGYNHRDYAGDGRFVEDLIEAGASEVNVPETLHIHR